MKKFKVDCYDILTVGIDIIGFIVNTISELVSTTILYPFLFHVLLKGKYLSLFSWSFFMNSQFSLLS